MILTQNKALFAKIETSPGVFTAPTIPNDIVAGAVDLNFNEVKPTIERMQCFNKITKPISMVGINHCEMTFRQELNPTLYGGEDEKLPLIALLKASQMNVVAETNLNWEGYIATMKEAGDIQETISFYYFEGNRRYSIKGAAGSFAVAGAVGELVYIDFNFMGVVEAVDTIAFPTNITCLELAPPIFKNSLFTLATITLNPIVSFNFDFANEIKERKDFRANTGRLNFYTDTRKPVLTIDPEGSANLGDAVDALIDNRTGEAMEFIFFKQAFNSSGTMRMTGTIVPNQYSREDRDGILAYSLPMELGYNFKIEILNVWLGA